MFTENFEQWFRLNKNATTPLNDLNKACTEICRRMTQQNLDIMGETFSRYSERLKNVSHIRKPEDLINLQKDAINEEIAATMNNIKTVIHNSMENFEEFTKLCSSIYESTLMTEKTAEKTSEKTDKYERAEKHHSK